MDQTPSPADDLRFTIQHLARAIRNNRSDEHLGDTQLTVLFLLADGPRTPSQLAAAQHVTPPSMNRTVNGLESSGLVQRTKSDDDARKVLVDLTPAGHDVLAETRRLRTAWFSRRLDTLDPAEREAVLAVVPTLKKLLAP